MEIPAPLIERLRRRIAECTGLSPKAWTVSARVNTRLQALALSEPSHYVALVEHPSGHPELMRLVEQLRVGETRFFRNRIHIAALRRTLIPAFLSSATPRCIRIWSAGCATGEEAFTLAILIADQIKRSESAHSVQIIATDLSDRALTVARQATFANSALEPVPDAMRRWAFEPLSNGNSRVIASVRRLVRFHRCNLLCDPLPSRFDLICCRNVLIYFTEDARKTVVARLAKSLANDGYLLVGHAESLRGAVALEPYQTPELVLYRLAQSRNQGTESAESSAAAVTSNSPYDSGEALSKARVPRDTSAQAQAKRTRVALSGQYLSGRRLARELRAAMASPCQQLVVDLDGAQMLSGAAARALHRARAAAGAVGIDFELVAQRPGIRRWARRHGFQLRKPS